MPFRLLAVCLLVLLAACAGEVKGSGKVVTKALPPQARSPRSGPREPSSCTSNAATSCSSPWRPTTTSWTCARGDRGRDAAPLDRRHLDFAEGHEGVRHRAGDRRSDHHRRGLGEVTRRRAGRRRGRDVRGRADRRGRVVHREVAVRRRVRAANVTIGPGTPEMVRARERHVAGEDPRGLQVREGPRRGRFAPSATRT